MKKRIIATMICVCIISSITACGASNANSNEQAEESAKPLTYVSDSNSELYTSNVIETEEGVTILCTSNYVLGPEAEGQFLFALREWSEECLENDYDWNIKFVSNGHIYQADICDYEGNCIATEKCNGSVTVGQHYGDDDTYVGKVVLYIEYDGKLFTAEFVRSGM